MQGCSTKGASGGEARGEVGPEGDGQPCESYERTQAALAPPRGAQLTRRQGGPAESASAQLLDAQPPREPSSASASPSTSPPCTPPSTDRGYQRRAAYRPRLRPWRTSTARDRTCPGRARARGSSSRAARAGEPGRRQGSAWRQGGTGWRRCGWADRSWRCGLRVKSEVGRRGGPAGVVGEEEDGGCCERGAVGSRRSGLRARCACSAVLVGRTQRW